MHKTLKHGETWAPLCRSGHCLDLALGAAQVEYERASLACRARRVEDDADATNGSTASSAMEIGLARATWMNSCWCLGSRRARLVYPSLPTSFIKFLAIWPKASILDTAQHVSTDGLGHRFLPF